MIRPSAAPWDGRRVLIALLVFFGVIVAVNGAMVWIALSSWPGRSDEPPRRDRAAQLSGVPTTSASWTA